MPGTSRPVGVRVPRRSGRRWLLGGLGLLCLSCLLGLVSPFLASLLAGSGGIPEWLVDLAAHWQWLFLSVLLLGAAITGLYDRRWRLLLLAAPLPWFSAWTLAPLAVAATAPVAAPTLSIASANVYYRNPDATSLLRWLAREQPDVVVILELTPAFAEGLRALRGFPYREVVAQPDAFGIAILSRLPLEQVEVVRDEEGIPLVKARIRWGERLIGISALHPMPPQTPHYHALRNRKLASLTPAIVPDGLPMIVAGDFNATPWSDAFSGLEQRGWRRATGLVPTWPVAWRGWLGIPIDHVLVSRQWSVAGSEVGPDIGSDHFPVLVRLALTSSLSTAPATARDGA